MTVKKDTTNLKVSREGYGKKRCNQFIISKIEKFKKKELNDCNIFVCFPPISISMLLSNTRTPQYQANSQMCAVGNTER